MEEYPQSKLVQEGMKMNYKNLFKGYYQLRKNISRYINNRRFDKDLGLFLFKKDGFFLYSNSVAHFHSYYNKIFIQEMYKFIPSDKDPLIIDCGANIGLGVYYWKKVFPNSKIIAFEPDPVVFKALQKNSEIFSDIELINKALSDKVAILKFTSNEKLSGSLNLSKKLDKIIEVQSDLLSKYINQKVSLLKIDIEGEEVKVLIEISEKLKFVENIFIEYHSFIDHDQNLSIILKMLETNGFRYYLESESSKATPFVNSHTTYNQDLQINIWGKKIW